MPRQSTHTRNIGRRITGILNTLLRERYLIKTASLWPWYNLPKQRKQRRRRNDRDKRGREGTQDSVRRVERGENEKVKNTDVGGRVEGGR